MASTNESGGVLSSFCAVFTRWFLSGEITSRKEEETDKTAAGENDSVTLRGETVFNAVTQYSKMSSVESVIELNTKDSDATTKDASTLHDDAKSPVIGNDSNEEGEEIAKAVPAEETSVKLIQDENVVAEKSSADALKKSATDSDATPLSLEEAESKIMTKIPSAKVETLRTALTKRPSSKRRRRKKKRETDFMGDPWDQLSSWNDNDTICNEFVPGYPKVYLCKKCGRTIESHKRQAVKVPSYVLKAIDARGEASRIIGGGDSKKGEIWLGGQVAVNKSFFRRQNISLCVTAALGLGKAFAVRRRATEVACCDLKWKDNSEQIIDWKDLRKVLKCMRSHRERGGSVLVHCAAGQSRSSTVVIAYLVTFDESAVLKPSARTVSRALAYAVSKRPMVRPNSGFQRQLRAFEERGLFSALREEVEEEEAKEARCSPATPTSSPALSEAGPPPPSPQSISTGPTNSIGLVK